MIRRGRLACSRSCGYRLTSAARQSADPSDDVLHHRVKKARGPASNYACVDCGGAAEDWSTVYPSRDDVWVRFQPRCRKCHRRYDGAVGEGNPRAKLTAGKVSPGTAELAVDPKIPPSLLHRLMGTDAVTYCLVRQPHFGP